MKGKRTTGHWLEEEGKERVRKGGTDVFIEEETGQGGLFSLRTKRYAMR